ncbi:DUF4179 domain-containing protein [Sporosarcina oncorhynchi]|uniref:DUF4179 domain-containing protein n=1 Tax=Sporosarcina oncorhynchi TaxID=3056444 RepID=A0ABZ0L3V4_9BACL|nr:DUF4179 domain-containing protein [Sporosarcina sp. T2O-4]WOV87226.1 DUF4179 domain-containing protein [Sporosarcina sp. T2O-4]
MTCPTIDKLSQLTDDLLPKEERETLELHIHSCSSCSKIVDAFKEENRFIEETLQTPMLPENFSDLILEQVEPYRKSKKLRRNATWKRVAVSAAGLVLAVGIGATVNPSFAQFLGGLFSTDQVDDGLKMAADAGLIQRVDLQVEDQGLTFVVEDVVADSSRVSLSYKILNKNGKPMDTDLKFHESGNTVTAFDQNGRELGQWGTDWQEGSDYGNIEFTMSNHSEAENVTIQFDLVEINGVKGNWKLEVPVDLQENRKLTKIVDLKDATSVHHGVQVLLKKLQTAPSTAALYFETKFTEEEQMKFEAAKRQLEETFGKETMDSLIFGESTEIMYHIENEDGKVVYSTERADSEASGMLQGSGEDIGAAGGTKWVNSFVPKDEDQLTFVLDGVYKTEATDISKTFKTDSVKKHPVVFDFKENQLTVHSVKKPLFGEDKSVIVKLKGGMESLDIGFGDWIAVDEKGKSYPTTYSGSILDETDENGRHIAKFDLQVIGLEEVPEELTLHLVAMRSYYPVENHWKVPLTSE